MSLILFKKAEKSISSVLMLSLIFQLTFPLTSSARTSTIHSNGGGGPVASALSSMVDGYSGDFHYSVPLASLPGPNGESVSINAGYHAGIGVNQKASWLGLGWDYNPGEITRQIVGAPDDYNGKLIGQYNSPITPEDGRCAVFGALYNNNINTVLNSGIPDYFTHKSGDNKTMYYNLSATERDHILRHFSSTYDNTNVFDPNTNASYRFNQTTVPYTGLAYDMYNVSGEGIGGAIRPQYLGDVQTYNSMNPTKSNNVVSTKKCQFYFENSSCATINTSNANSSTVVNTTTNRVHANTFVKYYTNAEINTNTNLYNNTTNTGYLDYKPTTNTTVNRRLAPENDPDAIGAFEVTNASGMTYHYSLPVYSLNEINYLWGASNHTDFMESNYAISWKLTAITGADYQDVNGNYMADEGDSGYWIAYNYSLWSDNYYWASQRYNAKSDAMLTTKMTTFATSSAVGNTYGKRSSLSRGHTQVYALNYIKTASHTAYFVKSIRLDEQSYDNVYPAINNNGTATSVSTTPLLKLDRVVVLRNEDKTLLLNNIPLGGNDLDNRFSYTTCSQALADQNFINITRYNANKTAIDQVALSTTELVTDYSLAKKYCSNINVNYSVQDYPIPTFMSNLEGFNLPVNYKHIQTPTYITTADLANSGKLTLKKITNYSLNGQKITPSVDFSYDETNPLKNPDFNIDKTDLWGYYKKDYVNSHYVTSISKDDVDAWSLKKISTSLGGEINITYESDRYHQEGFSGDLPFHRIVTNNPGLGSISSNTPHLIFPIQSISTDQYQTITFEDYDFAPFYGVMNEPYTDPNYQHSAYIIVSAVEKCTSPPFQYGTTANPYIYYQPPQKQVVRYGTQILESPTSIQPYSNGPFNSLMIGVQPEYTWNCAPNWTPSTTLGDIYGIGVDHAVFFRSYLYGGGVRVKQLAITDPFNNASFTQKFDYGDGYCPIVPKPMAFSTDNGPSNHDLVSNTKSLIYPQLTGVVGYSTCTQRSENAQGESTGIVTQGFNNALIANPLSMPILGLMSAYPMQINALGQPASLLFIYGNCTNLPPGYKSWFNFDMYLNLELNTSNAKLLGKPSYIKTDATTTSYFYTTYSTQEFYKHNRSPLVINYPNRFIYERTNPNQNPCSSEWEINATDTYHYDNSTFNNYDVYLKATSTTKDGITITNTIDRDIYALPYHSKTVDPTKGMYDTYTTHAFQEQVPNSTTLVYPSFNLKTLNETNRNVLNIVSHTSVIKANKYVVSESKVNYSNTYPIRQFNTTTGNYETTTITKPWYHLNESYERLLDDDVLATTVPTANDWRKLLVNTMYDAEHNNVEQEGLNGRKMASKWGYNNRYKLASIGNANYNSFTFSSFEDAYSVPNTNLTHYGGEVTHGETARLPEINVTSSGTPVLVQPHTGYSVAKVDPDVPGPAFKPVGFNVGRTYIAKVWVHTSSPATAALIIRLQGGVSNSHISITKTITKADANNVTVGNWVLMSAEVEVLESYSSLANLIMAVELSNAGGSNAAYFDDLSFHPKDAVITGNVYNEKTGLLIAQLDNDNFATLYNYDNAARLISSYKEYSGGIKKISESTYHYAKP